MPVIPVVSSQTHVCVAIPHIQHPIPAVVDVTQLPAVAVVPQLRALVAVVDPQLRRLHGTPPAHHVISLLLTLWPYAILPAQADRALNCVSVEPAVNPDDIRI